MIGIFGGSGFIGRNLIDHLVAQGASFKVFSRSAVPGFETCTVLIDFADPTTYRQHLRDLTSAVLLVSASGPGTFVNDMPSEVERNVLPYARFFETIESFHVNRIVYLSSGGTVYGVAETKLINEAHPTKPINHYGCAKLMIEGMIHATSARAPWTYTILRPSNPIGWYQTPGKGQGLVAQVVHCGLSGETMEVWGDGSTVRDYFDVRDLCQAVTLVLNSPDAYNSAFNVGSGKARSVLQVIDEVRQILGLDLSVKYKPARAADVDRNVLGSERLLSIGWRPEWSFESGVRAVAETAEVTK